ncbi:DNA replication/repair protein RecF [Pontixanthobacter gangjinensis]|uniref:DNA replication and repair protein RecF n=1 Tax=Pontixanthobacter gangjinensis TaxID=1028742 RepID=A0A6I4SRN5_9SPHN|nr:DNA replication/repair protein RecF [Pontixanthobacter gangjinensis]MXO57577.1 DNA replication/repair protein RecF [Pontixanthobacter gangjinensis]
MAIDQITLSGFRNHGQTRLDGTSRFNLLVGENGAGKTNVLEAISLLAPGRGLRRAALAEMAGNDGNGGFSIGTSLSTAPGAEPVRLATYTEATRPGRRLVRINGSDASAIGLSEWVALGWLTPAMDRLFTDSAGARRRFVDRMALALDPQHARYATRYEAALRERNRLLSDEREPEAAWLDGVEAHLAEYGAALSAGRANLISQVMAELAMLPAEPFARPALSYASGGPIMQEELAEALRDNRRRDRAASRTLIGPHRDELLVTMEIKHVAASTCSTGEQKAMLIAIILAHANIAARGRPNLLLLDEVAAHLDPVRRDALFERLRDSGAQLWLTGTELAPFAAVRDEAAIWKVDAGQVNRIS